MIFENENCISVWLGEGDIGTSIIRNEDNKTCGIGFHQLDRTCEIGKQVQKEYLKENQKYVTINFTNVNGINSLFKLINSFLEEIVEDSEKEKRETRL
jgi:putative protein kinase ArgK-like GTPase of G3E family